mmetsp:Transcript_3284/g.6107  ORF Transcript_3284/g.6107 Transcript_3284/m.6107 type:complete len:112 (-) Transcript_3284:13-348(-)
METILSNIYTEEFGNSDQEKMCELVGQKRPLDQNRETVKHDKKNKSGDEPVMILTERWNKKMLKRLVDLPWNFQEQSSHTLASNIYERIVDKSPDYNGFVSLQIEYNPSLG